MSIKHILVPLTGERHASHVPLCALALARCLGAHVTATDTVCEQPPTLDQSGLDIGAAYYKEILDAMEKGQVLKRTRARKSFDDALATTQVPCVDKPTCIGASTYWIDGSIVNGGGVTAWGRMADLIVIDRPAQDDNAAEIKVMEDGVFVARRPVLMVPLGKPYIGKAAAVAWNGSAEAVNSIGRALDLLEPGSTITIIQVGDTRPGTTSTDELSTYLGWHGFKSELRQIADQPKITGELILYAAKIAGAELLVMGAYTHSRFRETLFGGVTNYMLKNADIPVLLSR